MTFRILQSGSSLPFSFIVDPSAEFEAGQIAQLTVSGNQVVCGVSDGRAPIGMIDDFRTRSFSQPVVNEIVIGAVPSPTVNGDGHLITPIDIKAELKNPNIFANSFVSNISLALNARNGIVTFPAGTQLNFDMSGGGTPDSIRAIVSYRYQVPNIIGDDSTLASGKVTVWFQRFIGETDMYETNQIYPVNAVLFVSETGLLTTRQPAENYPAVAMVTAPPSAINGMLEFLWL